MLTLLPKDAAKESSHTGVTKELESSVWLPVADHGAASVRKHAN